MKKLITVLILSALVFSPIRGDAEAKIADARSYWLYETGTQQILAEYRSDMETPAASLTKLMTCLLTLEAVDGGTLGWEEKIKLPPSYENPGGSTMELKANQEVTIRQLVRGLMIVSANDGAEVLAKRIGGSESGFVARMNQRAGELGLMHTRFLNANGLPTAKGENTTTAADIGRLSEYMIHHYSDRLLAITSSTEFAVPAGTASLPATNTLMLSRKGVDGLKTGHTDEAGYCLAATMPFKSRSDARLIAVVMGTADEKARDHAAKSLLDWAEAHYDFVKLIDDEKVFIAGNWRSLASRPVSAHPEKSVERFIKKDQRLKTEISVVLPQQLPIHKGDDIGSMAVIFPSGERVSTPLISDTEILSITFSERIQLFFDSIRAWWTSFTAS